jgi:hypothetical protein
MFYFNSKNPHWQDLLSCFFGDSLPDDGLAKAKTCTRDILNDTYYYRLYSLLDQIYVFVPLNMEYEWH